MPLSFARAMHVNSSRFQQFAIRDRQRQRAAPGRGPWYIALLIAAVLPAAEAAGPAASVSLPERERLLGDPARIRSATEKHGIALDATIIGDYSDVLDGGAAPRATAARYLIEADLTLDTQPLFGWPGGTVRAAHLGFHGGNGNRESGDAQTYSNIDETPFDAPYSLW